MTAYTFPSEQAAAAKPTIPPQPQGPPGPQGPGLRVRFAKLPGLTPSGIVDRPVWLMATLAPATRQAKATHTEYTTVSAGDFSFPQGGGADARQLSSWPTLNALHLFWDAPWLTQRGQDPDAARATLFRILDGKRPVEMRVSAGGGGHWWDWGRWPVTFRSLQEEIRDGEADAFYMALELGEWRDPSQQRRTSNPRTPATRILQPADTLHSLSQLYYGTYTLWRVIRDANGISRKFGAKTPIVEHTRFKAGAKLRIPAKPSSASAPHKTPLASGV